VVRRAVLYRPLRGRILSSTESANHPERTCRESAFRLLAPGINDRTAGLRGAHTWNSPVNGSAALHCCSRGGSWGLCKRWVCAVVVGSHAILLHPSTILRMVPLPHEGGGDGRGVCGRRRDAVRPASTPPPSFACGFGWSPSPRSGEETAHRVWGRQPS
jgi:hypothetical protein